MSCWRRSPRWVIELAKTERIDLRAFQAELSERLKHKTTAEVGNLRLAIESASGHWLVRLADTGEVLPVPQMTPVPLTKPWFIGIANVRGALHGVIDFARFMGLQGARERSVANAGQSRLVLLGARFADIRAGLLVDRVLGLRNVADFQPVVESVNPVETVDPLDLLDPVAGVDGVNAVEIPRTWSRRRLTDASGRAWRELDLAALASVPQFLNVGAG